MYGTGSYSYNKYGSNARSGGTYSSSYTSSGLNRTANDRKSSTNPITGAPSYDHYSKTINRSNQEESKYSYMNASKQISESRA